MADGLEKQGDGPWPLGSFPGAAAELVPPGGVARLYDGVWSDDATPFRRGGGAYKSGSSFGSGGIDWLWSGFLAGGLRTVYHDSTKVGRLAADDSTSGDLFGFVASDDIRLTADPVVHRGALFAVRQSTATSLARLVAWAGTLAAGDYNTGTASVAVGSRLVSGSGTTWTSSHEGMFFAAGSDQIPVDTVNASNSLTLTEPWPGAALTSDPYDLFRTAGGTISAAEIISLPTVLASVAGRLLYASGSTLYVSSADTAVFAAAFDAGDYHTFSSDIRGVASMREVAVVFTADGTYAVSNLGFDLTDAVGNSQRRQERVNDLIVWGQRGIAQWRTSLVVPALDGVWLMDSISSPTLLSNPVQVQYLEYVRAGYSPGQATVFQGHYILPIVNGSGTVQDVLTCRLTPTRYGAGGVWAQMRGHGGGGNVKALTARPNSGSVAGELLAGGGDGRVTNLGWFTPSSSVLNDADGTTHQLELQTRAYPTGGNVQNTVRYVKARYQLPDDGATNPTLALGYAVDNAASFTAASATAPETATVTEYAWLTNKQARVFQLRFRTNNGTAFAYVKGVELQVARSGRQ